LRIKKPAEASKIKIQNNPKSTIRTEQRELGEAKSEIGIMRQNMFNLTLVPFFEKYKELVLFLTYLELLLLFGQ
jgi:hypothetical protein